MEEIVSKGQTLRHVDFSLLKKEEQEDDNILKALREGLKVNS